MIRPRPADRDRSGTAPDRGGPPALPEGGPGRPGHGLDRPDPTLARRHQEASPGRHRHRPLVPPGRARRRPALAAPARPDRTQRDPQALLSTNPDLAPRTILAWYLQRWQVEVTRSRRSAPTWAWRPSASGRSRPSPAPPRPCSACSAGSSWSPIACVGSVPSAPAGPPGMPRPSPPSPTSWPASAASSGPGIPAFFHVPGRPPTSKNSPGRRPHRSWPPSATRPDTPPNPHCPHRLCTKSSLLGKSGQQQ